MTQVLGAFAPLVKVRRGRLLISLNHFDTPCLVGVPEAGANRFEVVANAHPVYLPGILVRRPGGVAVVGPLQVTNHASNEMGIFEGTQLDDVPPLGQPLDHLGKGSLGEEIAIQVANQCRRLDHRGCGAHLTDHPTCVAQGTIFVVIDSIGDLPTDQSQQRPGSFDRLPRLVHSGPEPGFTFEIATGGKLQLVHRHPLHPDSQRLRPAQL